METEEAKKVRSQYAEADEKYRAFKKRGDFKKASEWKAKRDALVGAFNEAIKVLSDHEIV